MPRPLKRHGNPPLVLQARAGALARLDLAVARQVALEQLYVFVINEVGLLGAEPANLF